MGKLRNNNRNDYRIYKWDSEGVEAMNKYDKKHDYANDRRRLNRLLKKAGINFEWHHLYDGYQWTFPNSAYPNGDAIIHFGSYGHNRGNFETMGIGPEDDCIERTAKELIELLVKHE